MRRAASILALTVAAVASVATSRAPPGARIGLDPVVVWVDPAAPDAFTVQLDAGLDEDARRRAEITYGRVEIRASGLDGELPEDVELVGTASDGTPWDGERFDATCTAEACTGSMEIRVEAPPDAPPFPLQLDAGAFVGVADYDDQASVTGDLTVIGAVLVASASISESETVFTIDPVAPQRLLVRLEAALDASAPAEAQLRGTALQVTVDSVVSEPYDVRATLTDGITSFEAGVTYAKEARFFASCTADPCVATVEITFDAPADNGPFDVYVRTSAEIFADAPANPDDVVAGVTVAEAP